MMCWCWCWCWVGLLQALDAVPATDLKHAGLVGLLATLAKCSCKA